MAFVVNRNQCLLHGDTVVYIATLVYSYKTHELMRESENVSFSAMATSGFQWLPEVHNGYQWFSMATSGFQWLPEVVNCYQWLSMVSSGFQWFPAVLRGFQLFISVLSGSW